MSWIADMLDTTISYALPSGANVGGELTYGATVTDVLAKVELKATVARTSNGEEIQGTHIVATEAPLVEKARVWVDGESSPRLVKMLERATLDGVTLYEAVVA